VRSEKLTFGTHVAFPELAGMARPVAPNNWVERLVHADRGKPAIWVPLLDFQHILHVEIRGVLWWNYPTLTRFEACPASHKNFSAIVCPQLLRTTCAE
jgi:hypothetical protein